MSRPVIAVRDLVKTYGTGEATVHALQGISLAIERGEQVAVMGASGSGKSTLMHIIGCLDAPTSGGYLLDGLDVSQLDENALSMVRNRKIGFVFQSFNLVPRTTVQANVELPLIYAGVSKAERRQRAETALAAVSLEDRALHRPSELSGGQQQRAAIARALVTNPAIILADEPTGALDSASTQDVLGIFDRLHADGHTVIVITHEAEVAAHAGRVISLRDGRVVNDTAPKAAAALALAGARV